jgi:hypothetical protein
VAGLYAAAAYAPGTVAVSFTATDVITYAGTTDVGFQGRPGGPGGGRPAMP